MKKGDDIVVTAADDIVDDAFDISYPAPELPDTDMLVSIGIPPYSIVADPVLSYPIIIDQTEEINNLKKEIQALKDMIAEHILLGHE